MAPPISNDTTWLIAVQNGQVGPFHLEQMREFWASGQLNEQTYVWREGFSNWAQLGQLPELQQIRVGGESGGARAPGDLDKTVQDVPRVESPQRDGGHDGAQGQPRGQQREVSSGGDRAQPGSTSSSAPTERSEKVDFGMHQDDDYLDGVFVDLVKRSWKRHRRRQLSTEVDEVLVGGVITGVLDNGYSLIDLTSDGVNHYLRFEDVDTGNRVIFRLQHVAENLLTSKVLGHEAIVTIGYGTRVRDFSKTFKAVRQEMKGGYIAQADPGIITIDGDVSSQYIYVMVGLIWDIEDYLNPEDPYEVLYPKLGKDIGATLHSLRKYLHGRFGGGPA